MDMRWHCIVQVYSSHLQAQLGGTSRGGSSPGYQYFHPYLMGGGGEQAEGAVEEPGRSLTDYLATYSHAHKQQYFQVRGREAGYTPDYIPGYIFVVIGSTIASLERLAKPLATSLLLLVTPPAHGEVLPLEQK